MSLTVGELVPAPSFGEHHERVVAAPRAAIEQAMETVTVAQVRLLAPLMAVRARLARPTGPAPPGVDVRVRLHRCPSSPAQSCSRGAEAPR